MGCIGQNLLLPANEVWGKVMFSQVFLCLQGVGFSACITGHMTGGSASGGVGQTPPPRDTWDTVNKRAERIQLEYILVENI